MLNRDEKPSARRQPPSSVALGKRLVNAPSNQDETKNPKRRVDDSIAKDSRDTIHHMRELEYLTLREKNIRLVTISPSMRDGRLELTLDEASLTDDLEFHALSYAWGGFNEHENCDCEWPKTKHNPKSC